MERIAPISDNTDDVAAREQGDAFLPKFDAAGLLTAIAQHAETGEVLMVAFMDREALEATRSTGFAHFHSRSRGRLWKKGESSGHVLAVETIPEVEEAAAVAALLSETEGAAAWVSFSCADGQRIRSGARIEDAVGAVAGHPAVVAVGVNCTGPEHVPELVERIAAVTALPVVVYPNSGEAWDAAGRTWTGVTGVDVDGDAARAWVARGARLVGGCCRVTPRQIASITSALAAQ